MTTKRKGGGSGRGFRSDDENSPSNQPVSLGNCSVEYDSGKALKVQLDNEDEIRWIPSSVVHADSDVYDDDENSTGEIKVKRWWAEKEGLV